MKPYISIYKIIEIEKKLYMKGESLCHIILKQYLIFHF